MHDLLAITFAFINSDSLIEDQNLPYGIILLTCRLTIMLPIVVLIQLPFDNIKLTITDSRSYSRYIYRHSVTL